MTFGGDVLAEGPRGARKGPSGRGVRPGASRHQSQSMPPQRSPEMSSRTLLSGNRNDFIWFYFLLVREGERPFWDVFKPLEFTVPGRAATSSRQQGLSRWCLRMVSSVRSEGVSLHPAKLSWGTRHLLLNRLSDSLLPSIPRNLPGNGEAASTQEAQNQPRVLALSCHPHFHATPTSTMSANPRKIPLSFLPVLMFSYNTGDCFTGWKMATFSLSLLWPPTQPWKELFCSRSAQAGLYLGLERRGRGEGWPKRDKGTSRAGKASQDPSSLPPPLQIQRGLFERQKATKSFLEQCFHCYQIPLIMLEPGPDDTRMECSMYSRTFLPSKCIHLQGGGKHREHYWHPSWSAAHQTWAGQISVPRACFSGKHDKVLEFVFVAHLQRELAQTPG